MFDNTLPPGVGAALYRPGREPATAVSVHTAGIAVHPAVGELLDRTEPAMRSVFHGRCPDVVLLSEVAIEAEAELAAEGVGEPGTERVLERMRTLLDGSALAAILLRETGDPVHERPIPPCSSCAPALEALGVRTTEVPA